MALSKELEALQQFRCSEGKCVLSVYLNTDRADQDQQKGEWKIRLKNGLKKLEEYLQAAGDDNQLKSYQKMKDKVEKEIHGNQTLLQKGVVIFASEEQDLWSVHYLQVPVETSFHWETTPIVDQLEQIQRDYPKSAVILPNMDEVKVYDVDLGELHESHTYTFNPDTEEWTFKEGLASADRTASGASHVDGFEQRFRENLHRFYKGMATTIERMQSKRKWEKVYLVGEPEMVRSLESQLRIKVSGKVNKNLNNARSSNVIDQVFQ
ncbi:VLRF1 family aeRF1-type release factor [Bacillus shivajii]|uniref:VLRF1 family aeRF1-type release factor n=1 Tax=Bacillus shivajii TaxID=1983719 RepID=UPI001CFB5F65|nr:VLRF1 family aeRF1-type release factor [Bacillus shivajii]UCZ54060.1 VLRF1 family aeRF1-type release factor [Bacillus shivajii]